MYLIILASVDYHPGLNLYFKTAESANWQIGGLSDLTTVLFLYYDNLLIITTFLDIHFEAVL